MASFVVEVPEPVGPRGRLHTVGYTQDLVKQQERGQLFKAPEISASFRGRGTVTSLK